MATDLEKFALEHDLTPAYVRALARELGARSERYRGKVYLLISESELWDEIRRRRARAEEVRGMEDVLLGSTPNSLSSEIRRPPKKPMDHRGEGQSFGHVYPKGKKPD